MQFVNQLKRTHYCGDLRKDHVGETVVLMGWVDTRRDHGGLVFVDLRDRQGIVQVVLNPAEESTSSAKDVRGEYVIALEGVVRARPEGMINKNHSTGEVEIEAKRCEVLSEAETPPFQILDEKVTETLRLKYRYLDLRNPKLMGNIILRHEVAQEVRNYLTEDNFVEVETPILYKSTPEGARDYLVPSRVFLGNFFALPQSPQTLKQLLMIGGLDKYFQLCRCFRDEDLRADRQPEFSQIDIEMSFVDQDDVMAMAEGMAKRIWKKFKNVDLPPIPRMTYQEAMDRYGCDKPDLRIPWELVTLNETVKNCGFKVLDDVVDRGGSVKGLAVPGLGSGSRSLFDKLTTKAKQMGAKGLVWIKSENGKLATPIAKFFTEEKLQEIFKTAGGEEGGAVLIVADDFKITCAALSTLRIHLANELNAIDKSEDKHLWVTDFPLFDYSPEEKRWVAKHHPFTMPTDEDLHILLEQKESEYQNVKAKAYDLVVNGHETAGGSVRIHRRDVQNVMFNALGMSEKERKEKFGFFLEALNYGTPPHGGVAWGMDRLMMILCGTEAIRDVIAFPKTTKAQDLMADAPGLVTREQLIELGIRLAGATEKNIEKQT